MPLPDDQKVIALSNELLKTFDAIFGLHPGFRPAHAKGQMLTGTFTPTPAAAALSRAPHFNRPYTPLTARFSDGTGIPLIPDFDPNANPRGFAVRFNLAERVHTTGSSKYTSWTARVKLADSTTNFSPSAERPGQASIRFCALVGFVRSSN